MGEVRHHRDRSGKAELSGTRGERGWVGSVPEEAEPREAAELSRLATGVYGSDGGVRQCPLLGPGDRGARPRSAAGPPIYVKPFVKRCKNDAADAEAITEAAQRPTMHFVAVKTEAQQAQGMLFRTRDLLVRQRTQTINALRGHLAEYGVVAPQGRAWIVQLAGVLEDKACGLPEAVVELGWLLLERIDELDEKIDGLDRKIRTSAGEHEETARLMTIPGIGPITALALEAFAPPMESFRRGRDFSAWLGLVPRQHTTGGKPRLGRISKMGQRDLRRLLITGAMAVEEGGRGGPRQPDGAEGLGAGHKEGDLPGSRCRLSGRRKERNESKGAARERWQQDARTG